MRKPRNWQELNSIASLLAIASRLLIVLVILVQEVVQILVTRLALSKLGCNRSKKLRKNSEDGEQPIVCFSRGEESEKFPNQSRLFTARLLDANWRRSKFRTIEKKKKKKKRKTMLAMMMMMMMMKGKRRKTSLFARIALLLSCKTYARACTC